MKLHCHGIFTYLLEASRCNNFYSLPAGLTMLELLLRAANGANRAAEARPGVDRRTVSLVGAAEGTRGGPQRRECTIDPHSYCTL
eukprot:scaffold159803_cov25-Prasinocladus_malaysianus.AAC.1